MNLTISIPDTELQALRAKATASGVTTEQYALQVIARDLAPDWLRESWSNAQESGLSQLSMDEIEAEIAAARRGRRSADAQHGE